MSYTVQKFIDTIKDAAIKNMKATGVLASVTIAQGILESGYGNSQLAENANNLFGMKGDYQGQSLTIDTLEYTKGKPYSTQAKFRKYNSWKESIDDHAAIFLKSERYKEVIGEEDFEEACRKIHQAGYATNTDYADKLIEVIRKYKLYAYDSLVIEEELEPVVSKIVIEINGVEKEVDCIVKDNYNYIKLRDLADEKIYVDYNKEKKIPMLKVVDTKAK